MQVINSDINLPKMQVGEFTYGEQNITLVDFNEGARLIIGKFCSIARLVTVFLGGNHRHDWITTYPFGHIHQDKFPHHGEGHPATKGNVVIGNDVWIGSGATIMSGVTIGDGAVIGANAHVVKDVKPYTVVGGNPAKFIRYRFGINVKDENGNHHGALLTQQLIAIAWWNWPIEKIAENVPLLCSGNIEEFTNKHYNKPE